MHCRNRLWKPQPGDVPKRRKVTIAKQYPIIKNEYNERDNEKYTNWRADIIVRDRHKCILCGIRDFIHVHHIVRWIDDESLRYDIKNGVCLCIACHKLNHGPHNAPFPERVTNKLKEYIETIYSGKESKGVSERWRDNRNAAACREEN